MRYIVFDNTGEILRSGNCQQANLAVQAQQGEFSIESTGSDSTHYVDIPDNSTVKDKTANPATISGQTISNIYNPSTVNCWELGTYEVTDGEFIFTIDTPGTYDITVQSVPHFDETFTVTIT